MLTYIERWRGKSKQARSRIAFGIALSITGIIAIVWLVSLPARLASTTKNSALIFEGAKEGEMGELVDTTRNSLQDLVETAEVFDGNVPAQDGSFGATVTASSAPETLTPVIPRRVLIATTTGEKVE